MATPLYRFTEREISALGLGRHSDGGGLYLYVSPNGSSWVFRYTIGGRRRELGIGGLYRKETGRGIKLAQARRIAEGHRDTLMAGGDPKQVKGEQKAQARVEAGRSAVEAVESRKLANVAQRAFEARKASLRDDGKAGRWISPVKLHVLSKIGHRDVEGITAQDIATALRPIWHSKVDTSRKAITRLGACLSFARAEGLSVGRDLIPDAREILGKQHSEVKHIPAMPWADVPAYFASLDDGGSVALALRLLILTGSRSKPVRFAHVDQFSGDAWTIPGANMKGKKGVTKDFVIPLSPEALGVIEQAKASSRDGFLFPNPRKGVVSDMGMTARMKRDELQARPHGFRTSFRTWADAKTTAPYEAKELALAHKVGGMTERSYARGDLFEHRRNLILQWGRFVGGQADARVADMSDYRQGIQGR